MPLERQLYGQNPLDKLKLSIDAQKKRSDFIARSVDEARSLPRKENQPEADISKFSDDSEWRNAWKNLAVFSTPARIISITDPKSYLDNLEPDARKILFLQYLRENFPAMAVDTNNDFKVITETPVTELGNERARAAIRTFLAVGKELRNESVADDDLRNSTLHDAQEARVLTEEELLKRYIDASDNFNTRAFEDFCTMRDAHPQMTTSIATSPSALLQTLSRERTSFAAALKYEIFSTSDLVVMEQMYASKKESKRVPVEEAKQGQNKIKNQIDRKETQSFKEKMYENFAGLETWQKLAVVGAGILLVHKAFFSKTTGKWTGRFLKGGVGLAAFYLTGARDMFKDTAIGNALIDPAEKVVNGAFKLGKEGVGAIPGMPNYPVLNEKELEEYATFFMDIAKEEVGSQIECMGYMSQINMASIANSYELRDHGRGGSMNLNRDSALSKELIGLLGDGPGASALNKMRSNNAVLSDGMAHVFFLLGGTDDQTGVREVENARIELGLRTYDEIPDGHPARKTYERLAQHGIELARSTYGQNKWMEVVSQFVKPEFAPQSVSKYVTDNTRAFSDITGWNGVGGFTHREAENSPLLPSGVSPTLEWQNQVKADLDVKAGDPFPRGTTLSECVITFTNSNDVEIRISATLTAKSTIENLAKISKSQFYRAMDEWQKDALSGKNNNNVDPLE